MVNRVRLIVSFNGRWEELPDGGFRYVGGRTKGITVDKTITYEQFLRQVKSFVSFNPDTQEVELNGLILGQGVTRQAMVTDDDDLHFVLNDDKNCPNICVSLVERRTQQHDDVARDKSDADESDDEPHEDPTQDTDHDPHAQQFHAHDSGGIKVGIHVDPLTPVGTKKWDIPGAKACSIREATTGQSSRPNSEIYKGQFFTNKKELQRSLSFHALRKNFEWRVKRSSTKLFHAICKSDNCVWKCRAVKVRDGTFFHVRSFVDQHTCPLEERRQHRQASACLIGEVVASQLAHCDGRIMTPKEIIADMKDKYDIQILYGKAHKALEYASSLTYGTLGDSYQLLPSYDYVLEKHNPGTVTDLLVDQHGKFLHHFMAFGQSLRGFQRFIRPVIAVYGTHLKGRYKGTLFVACGNDGNDEVYPIAFGYGDYENNNSWTLFFQSLKKAIGEVPNLMFISDRHTSISEGIVRVFPEAHHVFCTWQIKKKVQEEYKSDIAQVFWDAAECYSLTEFNRNMSELMRMHPGCHKYVMDIGPEKWSRVHCPLPRYQLSTTNIVESLNSCLEFARQLPVTTLSEFVRNMMQRWYFDRKRTAMSWTTRLAPAVHEKVMDWQEGSRHMIASPIDWNVLCVKSTGNQCTVNLQERTCTCGKFQQLQLPCEHALAAARERNIDFTTLCADFYMTEAVVGAYSEPLMPVGGSDEWDVPDHIKNAVVLPPNTKPQTGGSQKSRTPSSNKHSSRFPCRHCGSVAHSSANCPNHVPDPSSQASGSTSNQAPSQIRRKCRVCHELGHNRQTCRQRQSVAPTDETETETEPNS